MMRSVKFGISLPAFSAPLVAGALALHVAACGPADRSAVATVRESAGVRIVEHATGFDGLDRWSLAKPPDAIIGILANEDPGHQFTEIRGAVRLSDSRIVVGDWGSREARYFDPSGNHLLTVGGAREGPGELRFLYVVDRLPGDTLVLGGWPIGSRYWFDERGEFIRNQALEALSPADGAHQVSTRSCDVKNRTRSLTGSPVSRDHASA